MSEYHWCGWGHMPSSRVEPIVRENGGEWFPKKTGNAVVKEGALNVGQKPHSVCVEL